MLRKATQSVVNGDSFGDVASNDIDDLVEEVLERQQIIKFTPEVEKATLDVIDSIREGQFNFAITKVKSIVSHGVANGYIGITETKSPASKTDLDRISDNTRVEN